MQEFCILQMILSRYYFKIIHLILMIHYTPIKFLFSRFKVAFSPFFIELNEDINRSKVCQCVHYKIPLISPKRIKTSLHDYIQDDNRNYFFRHKNHSFISVQHWYPCNFYTLSIALLFQVLHPNLKWSSKTLKLQELLLKKTSSLKTLPVSSFCELTFYNTASPK